MIPLLYHFFDYKYNIPNFESDLFGTEHIVYIFVSLIVTILLCILLRKTDHKKIDIFLKVLSILVIILEVTKISWESYYDISTGRGFNTIGIIPVYTCSIFIYCLFLTAWLKKDSKVRRFALSFLTTISLLSGLIGMIYCNGLNWYPFWTFGGWYSLSFHFSMFFVGMFLLSTGYKILDWHDIIAGWVPLVAMSVLAVPINYIFHADYMQIYEAGGVPVTENVAKLFIEKGLRPIFTILMIGAYLLFPTVVVSLYKLYNLVVYKQEFKESLAA